MNKTRCLLTAVGGLLTAALVASPVPSPAAPTITPFQIELSGSMPPGTVGLNLTFTAPSGKTLVIEYGSGDCFVPSGQSCVLSVFTEVNGAKNATSFNLDTDNVGPQRNGDDLWRAGQQVLLYAAGGTTVTLHAGRNDTTGSAAPISMSLSGHLE
jgi:hypothetical protein